MPLRSYTLNSSIFTNSRNQNSDPRSHSNSVCQVNHWHVSVSSSHSPWQQPPRHPKGATLLYPQVAVGVPGQLHFPKAVGLHLPPSALQAGCGGRRCWLRRRRRLLVGKVASNAHHRTRRTNIDAALSVWLNHDWDTNRFMKFEGAVAVDVDAPSCEDLADAEELVLDGDFSPGAVAGKDQVVGGPTSMES